MIDFKTYMSENLPSPSVGGFGSLMTILFGLITGNSVNQLIGILGGVLGLGIAFFAIVNGYRNNIKTQIETEREQIELRIKQLELERLEKEKEDEIETERKQIELKLFQIKQLEKQDE